MFNSKAYKEHINNNINDIIKNDIFVLFANQLISYNFIIKDVKTNIQNIVRKLIENNCIVKLILPVIINFIR